MQEAKMSQHNELIKTLSTLARVITIYTVLNVSTTPFLRKKTFFSERD